MRLKIKPTGELILSGRFDPLAGALRLGPIGATEGGDPPSNDTSLSVFTVNGSNVTDGQTVNLPNNTSSVSVGTNPTDPAAIVTVTGQNDLVTGDNTLTATVTNGASSQDYHVTLHVLNTGLAEITQVTLDAFAVGASLGGTGFAFSSEGGRYGVWFNSDGVNSQPDLGASIYYEVDVSSGDDATICAAAAYSVISSNGFSVAYDSVRTLTITGTGNQSEEDAISNTAIIVVNITQQGADPS